MKKSLKGQINILNQLYETIDTLNDIISNRGNKYELLKSDFPEDKLKTSEYSLHKKRLAIIKNDFDSSWLKTIKELDVLCQKIRKKQPHLNDLSINNINKNDIYPDAIVFGRVKLSYENWNGYIPRLFPFPFRKSFWLTNLEKDRLVINQFLLRIMFSLPTKLLDLIAIDPLLLGDSIAYFKPLLKLSHPFKQQRILTRSDEIEATLEKTLNYIEDLIQNKFTDDIQDWIDFNKNIDNKEKLVYKVILVFGVPEQLNANSQVYLKRLIDLGPKCGVLPVLIVEEDVLNEVKYKHFRDYIYNNAISMNQMFSTGIDTKTMSNFDVVEESEYFPNNDFFSELIDWLYSEYEKCERFTNEIEDLWETPLWDTSSASGLKVPIGWKNNGDKVVFSLGCVDSEHHALIAGRSGSGKSNLLHVLIQSLCHNYSPKDIEIYLLDYKQGTEFNAYVNPPLPHARLVAVESSPEYGIRVLEHLVNIINNRAIIFKENGIRDIYECHEKLSIPIPRLVIIIDEFQILFSEGRQVSEPAEKLLTQLLRQGRSYGIHLILATQTLKGIQTQSITQLISQIGCRVALSCSEEDSMTILGGNSNYEASTLKSPPEGILNDSNGSKTKNQRFNVPFAESDICDSKQITLYNEANRSGFKLNTKVFNGAHLPMMPSVEEFKKEYSPSLSLNLCLGEKLSFETEKFILEFQHKTANNLLIVGADEKIQKGLLFSLINSLTYSNTSNKIFYYNGKFENKIFENDFSNENLTIKQNNWDGNSEDILANIGKLTQILIIDGLDLTSVIHSATGGYVPQSQKDKKASPSENFKKILEIGAQNGTFVVAFVDNWKRCNLSCRDYLNFFDLRIGFNLNEDDAGSLVSGTIGKFKGLEQGNKAIFTDRLRNHTELIRPYIKKDFTSENL